MSLRSGSPCTSTSSPSSSCSSMTSAISAFIRRSYSASSISPGTQRGARDADRRGLREGPDGGGRQRRQVQPLVLAGATVSAAATRRCPTSMIDARRARTSVVVQPRVRLAGRDRGVGAAISSATASRPSRSAARQSDHFAPPSRRRTPASCAVRRRGRSRGPASTARAASSRTSTRRPRRPNPAGWPACPAPRRGRCARCCGRRRRRPPRSCRPARARRPRRRRLPVDQVDADRLDRCPGQRRQRGAEVTEVGGDEDRRTRWPARPARRRCLRRARPRWRRCR